MTNMGELKSLKNMIFVAFILIISLMIIDEMHTIRIFIDNFYWLLVYTFGIEVIQYDVQ